MGPLGYFDSQVRNESACIRRSKMDKTIWPRMRGISRTVVSTPTEDWPRSVAADTMGASRCLREGERVWSKEGFGQPYEESRAGSYLRPLGREYEDRGELKGCDA